MTSTDLAHDTLRLLSANIQAGARTDRYRDYLTQSLNHVLPHASKRSNLEAIAASAREFDLVGLQESDPGSLRSGFLNQTHYLAELAGFPFWSHQANRRLGRLATSANALLSRHEPSEVRDYALPGRVKGRGVLWARFELAAGDLVVLIAHLSLGAQSRLAQLGFIAELLHDAPNAVLMGDLNCETHASELSQFLKRSGMQEPRDRLPSYPSWQPKRAIDHILTSPGVEVHRRWLLPTLASDHLAVGAEISLRTGEIESAGD